MTPTDTDTPTAITIELEMRDGVRRVTIPLDFEDFTLEEGAAALLLAGPKLRKTHEPELADTAAFLFVRLRRELPELTADDYPTFRRLIVSQFREAMNG